MSKKQVKRKWSNGKYWGWRLVDGSIELSCHSQAKLAQENKRRLSENNTV